MPHVQASTPDGANIVDGQGIYRDFPVGGAVVHALRGVDIVLRPGELVALRGRSGSGKTTLLNLLVGLDDPTRGQIVVLGHDLSRTGEKDRAKLRREHIGMLFQNAHLFPSLTALENVEIPLRLLRAAPAERNARAVNALDLVKLAGRARHRGLELSGGEQQRVALARAIVHDPSFVIADEPTGNLDSTTGRDIIALIRDLTHRLQIGFLVATHDPTIVATADRVLLIQDGRITEQAKMS
jgi:ABC-type lipoprotein export system ATPase subunit